MYKYPLKLKTFIKNDLRSEAVPFVEDVSSGKEGLDMEEYFNRNFPIFIRKIDDFAQLDRRLSEEEEQELRFMLDALISAKNISKSE